jgi:hypothetical protein
MDSYKWAMFRWGFRAGYMPQSHRDQRLEMLEPRIQQTMTSLNVRAELGIT